MPRRARAAIRHELVMHMWEAGIKADDIARVLDLFDIETDRQAHLPAPVGPGRPGVPYAVRSPEDPAI